MESKHNLFELFLFTFIVIIFIATANTANAVSTTCGLVNVDYNNNLTLLTGESGSFTVNIFNQGTTTQRITANAQCNPLEIDCSFTGINENTLIAPGEQKSFSLDVQAKAASGSFQIPATFNAGPSNPTCTSQLQFTTNVLSQQGGAIEPLTAWITPTDSQNARPGDLVEFTISLKNNLNKKIYAGISATNTNPFETSTTLSASNIALQAGESKQVSVKVRLPPGTPGGTYNWIYKVDAGNCCSYDLSLPVAITVEAPHLDVQLLNAPVQGVCIAVDAGSTTTIPLSIENNGEVTGPFDLTIDGTTTVKNAVSITEPKITLLNGEEKQFQIKISPTSRTPIDNYTYKLRGNYQGFTFLNKNYCFTVHAVESVKVDAPTNLVIERSRLTNAFINITNTGSVRDDYALSITPNPELTIQLQPSTVTLNPGETQTINLAITSDLSTPLGQRIAQLRLDAPRYSKNIALNATVYATGRTGESLLKVTSESEFKTAKGITRDFNVTVENLGTNVLRDVSVTLDNVDASWFSSESNTILPGGSEEFTITLTIPQNAPDQISTNLIARSGDEFVSVPLTITASPVAFEFVINEIIENKNSAGETTSVDFLVTLTNTGRNTVTQAAPLINDLDYVYTQSPASVTLEAGKSTQVRINLKPAAKDTSNKTIQLEFTAQEGTTGPQSIVVPALVIASTNLTMKIAMILALLIAIVAVVAKTQEKR